MIYHYSDKAGYDVIRSQPIWKFEASQPPGKNPYGTYFTRLEPDTKLLANKLRIPKRKIEFCFEFADADDLEEKEGDKGEFIVFSSNDYFVTKDRQGYNGASKEWKRK